MDSVISSTDIVPLLTRWYRLSMLSPVRSEISCRGLNPPFRMLPYRLFIRYFLRFPARPAYLFTFCQTKKQPFGCLSGGQVSRARGRIIAPISLIAYALRTYSVYTPSGLACLIIYRPLYGFPLFTTLHNADCVTPHSAANA